MSDGAGDTGEPRPGGTRPEVVDESVLIVTDAGSLARRYWGMLVAVGVVAVVFGIIVLANVWASIHLVAVFAGLFLLFAGVMQLFVGSLGTSRAGRIVGGLLAIIAGIVLIAWPDASVKTVAMIVGLSFLVWGVVVALFAITDHGEGRGAFAGFGVILAIVGIVFIAWPGPTVSLLMILVGISAMLFGIASIAQGLSLRRS